MNQPSSHLPTLKRTPSLGLSMWYMGNVLTNLVEKKDNNGAFSLLEATLLPGNEPPPHVHSREDKLFPVLEGKFDVYVGEAFNLTQANPSSCPSSGRMRLLSTPRGFACSFSSLPAGWKELSAK